MSLREVLSHLTDPSLREMNVALRQAAGLGKTECVRVLLDHGAEINAPGNKSGRTALQEACAYGCAGPDMIELLVCRGADPHFKSNFKKKRWQLPLSSMAAKI